MRCLSLGVLLFCLLGRAALAADLPAAETPTMAPPPRPLPSWQLPRAQIHGRRPNLPRPQLDPTAAANVLLGDDLRDRHLSVPEALDAQAGLRVQQLSGFGAQALLAIRGSTAEQVDVYVDDLPVQALDGTPFDLADLPTGQIERVEVYRAMAPALLGSQAVGGALRLTLRRPAEVGGEANVGFGSYGARQAEAAAAWHTGATRISGGIRLLHADGNYPYRFDNATQYDRQDDSVRLRQNNFIDRLGGTLAASQALTRQWTVQARWFGAGLQQGLPGPALFEARSARLDRQRHLAALALEGRGIWRDEDSLRVTAQGGWLATDVADPAGELGIAQRSQQTLRTMGAQVLWEAPLAGPLSAVTRLALTSGDVATRDVLSAAELPAASRQGVAAGLALPLQWRDGTVHLVPFAGIEAQHSRRTTDVGYPFTVREVRVAEDALWTARFAAAWDVLPWLQPRLAVTRGMRAPSLHELYGNDGVIHGNARLLPETALSAEAGVRVGHAAERWSADLEAHAYWKSVDNLIQLASLNSHEARFENLSRARLLGVEVQASARAFKGLRVVAQHTTLAAVDISGAVAYDGKALPMRPRTRWAARLDWTQRLGPLALRPFAAVQWQAGHFLDAANLVVVPGQSLLGGGLRLEHKPWQLFAELRVDNALDAAAVDMVGYPLPGRTFWLQLGWRLWRDEEDEMTAGAAPNGQPLPEQVAL